MQTLSIDNHSLRKELGLGITDFTVLLELGTSVCTISNLSKEIGITKDTIYRSIKHLTEQKYYLEKRGNFYRFTEVFYKTIHLRDYTPELKVLLKQKSSDFVYLMIDEHTNLYKIGKSNNVSKRERTLAAQIPRIKTIHFFKQETVFEKTLHNMYKDKRVRGEWFELTKEDVEFIKTL